TGVQTCALPILSSQAYDRVPRANSSERDCPEILERLAPPNLHGGGAVSLSSSGGEGRGEGAASLHRKRGSWRDVAALSRPSCLALRVFDFPPWARAQLVSPHTGQPAAEGETGLIRVFDLANV